MTVILSNVIKDRLLCARDGKQWRRGEKTGPTMGMEKRLVDHGMLEESEDGRLKITDKGRKAIYGKIKSMWD